ncbi:hypothetical protein JYU34_019614 [Plutella xylostella]|uniref:Protein Skeletor n=1 Tax=Plutella xylostella TaxID=51655 RepID=A0ABQ7PXG1_PLUXY|nr:hypothetical protein JYU34_019614 [Plutella xylostella]
MRFAAALALLCLFGTAQAQYFGKDLGALSELHHGVRGRVFAVDSRTLYIKDFTYDGEGPAAYFYVGTSKSISGSGTRLRDERGASAPLRRYRGEPVTLTLPEGTSLKDVKWFSVWCDEFSVNFGDVRIPRDLEYPRPAKVGALSGVHGVSSDNIVVVDAQTLLIPNFSYDGEAPDAKFWVGRGDKPSPQGIRIPDENGKETPLRRYDRKTIVLTLPGELTVFDIGYFSVWCEAFTVNFGHVALPSTKLSNVPPSLKMLGVSPQSKLNCEVLYEDMAFEVRWAVAGDSIVLQLVAKLEDGEYMSFGLSGDATSSQMVGGDVAVAWVDKTSLKGYAHDYYLDAKSQCAGVRGSCPDERLGAKTNSLRLLNAALVNGYSIVTYQRGLRAADQLDRAIYTNVSQPIIWATGPLNSRNEVSYHSHFLKGDKSIEFGRPPVWNCPMPETEEEGKEPAGVPPPPPPRKQEVVEDSPKPAYKPNPVPPPKPVPAVEPWEIPPIQCHEPADGVFYAQMGPTGGKQGYSAITGHVGWGISWYINGLLIPEINVVRGRKYTFVVEGGSNPDVPARYHPFYITNDPVGGYFHRSQEERKGVEIYAGVRQTRTGELIPTGVGRLCNWTPDTEGPEADEYPSFGAYQRSLTLVCEEGNPGVVTWIPDKNTPDTVYYQCFTHRHLGWKINVLDECDVVEAEGSRVVERVVQPEMPDLLQGEESVQVYTKVKPGNDILDQRKKYEKIINAKKPYNNFSKLDQNGHRSSDDEERQEPTNNQPQYNQAEYELPITKNQLKSVIESMENLENNMKDEFIKNIKLSPSTIYREGIKDTFLPEQPLREDEDFTVEAGNVPNKYMLPPNQKPLTLQAVMRPHGPHNNPKVQMHMGYRRPVPPEIKRRPPPHPMGNMGSTYPLQMPNPHGHPGGPHGSNMKKYHKNSGPSRLPPPPNMHMNRPAEQRDRQPPNKMKHHGPNPQQKPVQQQKPISQQPPAYQQQQQQQFSNGPPPSQSVQSIIMGKPINSLPPQSQTLSLGKTDLIANQVVKSQITLPGFNEPVAQHSAPPSYLAINPVRSDIEQIILGKPMENPVPLDQQMMPTKQYPIRVPEIQTANFDMEEPQRHNDMKSSDFLGESSGTSTVSPAKNTGFKPSSIVIESGFKPIIREPLMESEDTRVSDDDINQTANRREDTHVEDDYIESAQIPNFVNNNHNFPSEPNTQSFEPMFIPSPEDHMLPSIDLTKEVFPSNHAKEDRPHPVYVKTESELTALFSQKNLDKEVPADMVMESNKVSPQYLPPDPKQVKEPVPQKSIAQETFTTYDGKTVSAASLTALPVPPQPTNKGTTKLYSAKLPKNSEQLLRTPQFRPFKGQIPPLILEELQNSDIQAPSSKEVRSTNLKFKDFVYSVFDLKPPNSMETDSGSFSEFSEKHEPNQVVKKTSNEAVKKVQPVESKKVQIESKKMQKENKRSPQIETKREQPVEKKVLVEHKTENKLTNVSQNVENISKPPKKEVKADRDSDEHINVQSSDEEDGSQEVNPEDYQDHDDDFGNRRKRDTGATEFEHSPHSQGSEPNHIKETSIKNQVDFLVLNSASTTQTHWMLNTVLLLLIWKLL